MREEANLEMLPDAEGPARRKQKLDPPIRQYMLEDHPFLVPGLTMLLSGACIYSTIFSNIARDLLVPSGTGSSLLGQFNTVAGWTVAFALAIFFLAAIFLVVNLIALAARMARRKPLECPACGAHEPRIGAFPRERLEGYSWQEATCPRCGERWYVKL